MKAVVVEHPGGPEALKYQEIPTPQVKPGWSLVKVKAFGVNHSEIFTRQGKSPTVSFPRILGIECVGEIAKTTDPEHLPVGQTIMSLMGEMGRDFDGGYAEYVLLPNEQIYPINSNLSWTDLAAIPETYYTAYGALTGLRLSQGDSLLVRGGTSGVGIAAAKLAKAVDRNIHVTGTTREIAKKELLLNKGFDDVILDKDDKLQTELKFDKILELIGPKNLKNSLAALAFNGIVSSTGELGGVWDIKNFDPIPMIPNNRYLTSFSSGDVNLSWIHDMLNLIEERHVDVSPTKIYHLDQVDVAHAYLESGQSIGKVVISVE